MITLKKMTDENRINGDRNRSTECHTQRRLVYSIVAVALGLSVVPGTSIGQNGAPGISRQATSDNSERAESPAGSDTIGGGVIEEQSPDNIAGSGRGDAEAAAASNRSTSTMHSETPPNNWSLLGWLGLLGLFGIFGLMPRAPYGRDTSLHSPARQ